MNNRTSPELLTSCKDMNQAPRPSRLVNFFDTYTKDVTAEDLQRLFTRDAREAYKFFTRGMDAEAMQRLPWYKRVIEEVRLLFFAFSMKLSDRLFDEGVFAQGIAFPTVAHDAARVRTIVTATHTREELQFALDVFARVGRELGIR